MKKSLKIMAMMAALSSGSIAAEYKVNSDTFPLLTDAEPARVFDFVLKTDTPRTLKSIDFTTSGTTDLGDVLEVSVVHLRQAGDRSYGTFTPKDGIIQLSNDMEFPKGGHKFRVFAKVKKGANLLNRVGLQITNFDFAEGDDLSVAVNENYQASRLAYRIHKTGDHKAHTFRIPACTKANDGSLLAVYDMRYNSARDLQEHMDIGLSRSTDGGQTWSDPVPIMDMGEFGGKPQKENGCSDPGILVDKQTGEIFVTACWTHGKPNTHQWLGNGSEPGHDIHKATQFMCVRSKDNGKTWSKPENWTEKLKDPKWVLFVPAPGNGITMTDGTLVMPTQGRDENGLPFSNLIWSKDRGVTWNTSKHARDNTTECAIAELSDGKLILSMRDNRNRKDKGDTNGRAVGVTSDLGETWTKHAADHGALPEPVCMASLISHKCGCGSDLLFFSNPHDKKGRRRMTIQMSHDDGETWPEAKHVLLDSGSSYGYSSLVVIDDKTLGILYESSVADMTFQLVPMAEFGL